MVEMIYSQIRRMSAPAPFEPVALPLLPPPPPPPYGRPAVLGLGEPPPNSTHTSIASWCISGANYTVGGDATVSCFTRSAAAAAAEVITCARTTAVFRGSSAVSC